MALVADTDLSPPKGARALAITGAACACMVMAAAATITLLGNGHHASVRLDLTPPAAALAAPVLRAENLPDTPTPAVTTAQYAGRALIADPALIENTPLGPLPRIADDGRKPMTAYAAPAAAGKFKIAIVMTGLGLSAKATGAALAGLPPSVTVGLLPYAADAPRWLNAARADGHEVLLEVPM
ncbi:MAG: divergent polysaccharide deacetylase family protein [Alphaproteobacteria bacterium]|nr:divergent polysaccharide deacetylase family protein [Alphaproteobacteria bacterium]